jgi:hypothetical protein
VQEQELEHAARDREAGAEGEGGAVMQPGEVLEGLILVALFTWVGITFMHHYDPKAKNSRARRILLWHIPQLVLFCFMLWLFYWLRNR